MTCPSFAERRMTLALPFARSAVTAASISPEGLGAKPNTWVKGVFSGFGERSLP